MAKIRLTKEFRFEMAHALPGYDGKCRFFHGHSYVLFVTVEGCPIDDTRNPKNGMVVDFNELKQIVNKKIVEKLDHSLMIRYDAKLADEIKRDYENVEIVDYQPTCENMVVRFAESLKNAMPQNVTLHHLRLHETATSYAEWYAEDNE